MTDQPCPSCGGADLGDVRLTRTQKRIYDALRRGGQVDLFELFGGCIKRSCLKVHVHNLNDRLAVLDLRVVSCRTGRYGGVYTLIKLPCDGTQATRDRSDPVGTLYRT